MNCNLKYLSWKQQKSGKPNVIQYHTHLISFLRDHNSFSEHKNNNFWLVLTLWPCRNITVSKCCVWPALRLSSWPVPPTWKSMIRKFLVTFCRLGAEYSAQFWLVENLKCTLCTCDWNVISTCANVTWPSKVSEYALIQTNNNRLYYQIKS